MTHKEKSRQVCLNMGALAKSAGVTQQHISEVTGIRQGTISRLFQGNFSPTLDTVWRVLGAIGDVSGKYYTLQDIQPKD